MAESPSELKARIRQDLNACQAQLKEKLDQLLERGLISRTEIEQIVIEAKVTGQEVVNALNAPASQVEEVTEIYVYSLFERYKESVQQKIVAIESKSLNKPTSQREDSENKKEPKSEKGIISDLFGWFKSFSKPAKNAGKPHRDVKE